MVGDAHDPAGKVALNDVDFALYQVSVEDGGALELQLEMLWKPGGAMDRDMLEPAAQIGPQFFHFALPDALDCRSKMLGELSCHSIQCQVERNQHVCQALLRNWQQVLCLQVFD